MIDYVEIRNASLEPLGLIDTAKSIIWNTEYFGAGAFELYTEATPAAVSMLKVGNFVTRIESDGVGIIEAINVTFDIENGRMITASGRLAKSILDRRLITYVSGNKSLQIAFSGNVEARARGLVQDNAVACYKDKARTVPYTERNISILQLGDLSNLPAETELRQASNENLLTYTDDFLHQYNYGAKLIRDGSKLSYVVYAGKDRSIGNAEGNEPVIFSEDFDNLSGSDYIFDDTAGKSYALVGGEGEGNDRFFVECNAALSGLARRETFVDSSLAREVYEEKFTGDGVENTTTINGITVSLGVEGTTTFRLTKHAATAIKSAKVNGYETACKFDLAAQTVTFAKPPMSGEEIIIQYIDDDEYRAQLTEEGKQELATLIAAEGFEGSIDLTNSSFEYGIDFSIGDIVTVQDNGINKYINVRVVSVDEVQDDNGYQVNLNFEAV